MDINKQLQQIFAPMIKFISYPFKVHRKMVFYIPPLAPKEMKKSKKTSTRLMQKFSDYKTPVGGCIRITAKEYAEMRGENPEEALAGRSKGSWHPAYRELRNRKFFEGQKWKAVYEKANEEWAQKLKCEIDELILVSHRII